MKKLKYLDEFILIFILLGSLTVAFIFINNVDTIKSIFLGNNHHSFILNVMSFFTITTTLLSIIRVNYFKNSKLWFIPIFLLSFIGTFIYSSIGLIYKLKNRSDLYADN